MAVNVAHLGLAINTPLVTPAAQNYRPQTWPPQHDFPIVIDADGKVVSRYGDPTWNLRPWAKKPIVLNFGDGPQIKGQPSISVANADLFRHITAWWLYGFKAVQNSQTLKNRFNYLRSLFILCSTHGITASELMRFPAVADRLPEVIAPSQFEHTLTLLHALYEQREQLGFTLLDRSGLARLEAAMPEHESRQTPYIPPRTMYEVLGKEVVRLFSDRFVSPHGEKRKAEILNLVDPNDSKRLTNLAQSGKVSWRETLLGGCTSTKPCTKGCIENVALCGGSDEKTACPSILYDREKVPALHQLSRVIASRLVEAPEGSPLRDSLEAQQRTVEYVLNVL